MRGGLRTDGFMVGSCSDHSRIGRALEMTFHQFSANFFEIRDGHFSWQAQYLVSLDYAALWIGKVFEVSCIFLWFFLFQGQFFEKNTSIYLAKK